MRLSRGFFRLILMVGAVLLTAGAVALLWHSDRSVEQPVVAPAPSVNASRGPTAEATHETHEDADERTAPPAPTVVTVRQGGMVLSSPTPPGTRCTFSPATYRRRRTVSVSVRGGGVRR